MIQKIGSSDLIVSYKQIRLALRDGMQDSSGTKLGPTAVIGTILITQSHDAAQTMHQSPLTSTSTSVSVIGRVPLYPLQYSPTFNRSH